MGLTRHLSITKGVLKLGMQIGLYICEPIIVILLWLYPQPVSVQIVGLFTVPLLWAFWPQIITLRDKILPFMAENGVYLLWASGVSPILLLVAGFIIIPSMTLVITGVALFTPALLAVCKLPNQAERNDREFES